MNYQTSNNKDEENDKNQHNMHAVLDEIDNLLGLDELISIPNLSAKDVIQGSDEYGQAEKVRKRRKKMDDYFKIDRDLAKLDVEEFKRQITFQKEIYIREIKNKTPTGSRKDRKKKNMEDLFGNLENIDPELLKKTIQEKKEEFIKNIKSDDLKSTLSQNENPPQDQIIKEKADLTNPRTKNQDLDVFSEELQNMGINELKSELHIRKIHYKQYVKNKKVVEIAKDLYQLEMIIRFVSSHSPEISNYKPSFIYRRIKKRLTKLKFTFLVDYADYLKLNLNEIELLEAELSINVTQFMRDRKTWKYLETTILPEVMLKRKKKIILWSAATAIGCEAYSLAIINLRNSNTNYEVISTDVNNKLLSKARQGSYESHHIKELSETDIKQFFTIHEGRYKIKSYIRKNTRFYKLNLFSDIFPKNIDIILARNVWIYFEKPELVYHKMYNSLNCNGYLVLGGTEIVPTHLRHMFKLVNVSTQTYQKICT